jgi:hypothetical protein
MEKRLHRGLERFWVRGEWFADGVGFRKAFAELCDKNGLEFVTPAVAIAAQKKLLLRRANARSSRRVAKATAATN